MNKSVETNTPADGANPPKRRRGGQPGNRNAAKPVNALCQRIRGLRKRARAAIAQAQGAC